MSEKTRLVTWSDPVPTARAGRGMAGIDYLRAMMTGALPGAPIGRLVGMRFTEVEHGRVVMRLMPADYHYNPLGTVHGGVFATVLDSVMGCAVHSTLPKGRGYTTMEIKVNYLRAVTAESGELVAEGKVVHVGRRSGVAEARVTDAAGKVCAVGSTTCLVFDLPPD